MESATSSARTSPSSRRRTPSSKRARTRCPRRSSIASSSKIRVGYPSADEEDRILAQTSHGVGTLDVTSIQPVISREALHAVRPLAGQVAIEPRVRGYVRDLCRASRTSPLVMLGAGPRAGVHLLVASRWAAALDGRTFVTPDDVKRVLHQVVCHRLVLAPEVELDGMKAEEVIDRIATTVEVPR